jgi:hypothetical protein
MLTPPGLWLGRLTVAWNGALLVREVWYRFCTPGTFRALVRAAWHSLRTGQPFQWPSSTSGYSNKSMLTLGDGGEGTPGLTDPLRWYVTTADLEFYKDAVERDVGPCWEEMLRKDWEGCSYVAWRRTLPSGKTEYKSTTVCENATAEEFMDFYLDDDVRPKWDSMIKEHQLLENAHGQEHRCQVVRWLRAFPFAFISKREYVIARRVFQGHDDSTLYGITKGVDHPAAPLQQGVVRMATFYSMWRSKTVACPKGTNRPACETTLLHFEDFGIPENLARFTIRHGMAGFVGKMVPHVEPFVMQRRSRCSPYGRDSQAYGFDIEPVLPSKRPGHWTPPEVSGADDKEPEEKSRPSALSRSSSFKGLGYMIVASGVAIALSRVGSTPSLNDVHRPKHAKSKHHTAGIRSHKIVLSSGVEKRRH